MLSAMAAPLTSQDDPRVQQLFAEQLAAIHRRADRRFGSLLLLQWLAGIAAAVWISPLTWTGTSSATHPHVWAALLLGSAITIPPLSLILARPGAASTRQVIAVAQMLWSALLIHLTGGRIETHFHVFGSLALLAWYRDWRVLVTAMVVVTVDHFVRGIYYPQSVYGVLVAPPWRSLEHGSWVAFECVFLYLSIQENLKQIWQLAVNHAALELDRAKAEAEVQRQSQELRGTEEKLRQAQKMEAIGQLAGGVAHDFNNLLTVIAGHTELLLVSRQPADAPCEGLLEIQAAAERAASLTRQLLAFSRKQILAPKLLDLNAVVNDVEKMLRRLIGEDIELTTVLQPGLGWVSADPGQLQQVILNLALNARDAMLRGGRLTIETGTSNVEGPRQAWCADEEVQPGPYISLMMTDTGCGMDAATKARLFEPFFTTKEVGKGTGLGLATVYGIVRQSGGFISVYSEPGLGATFKIYLPRVSAPCSTRPEVAPADEPPRGLETILLVEDEDKVRSLARAVLQSAGYRVLEARHGREGLAVVEQHAGAIDIVVTDVVMPQMGGRQLIECLRALHPRLKVLYMSGYTDDAIVRHGILEAGTAFLQKPFSPRDLRDKVRRVLDSRGSQVGVSPPGDPSRRGAGGGAVHGAAGGADEVREVAGAGRADEVATRGTG